MQMKIVCTKDEKDRFCKAIEINHICPFMSEYCSERNVCDDCLVEHIEWEITDGDKDEVLELLKEQQPKKGHWQPYEYGDDTWHQCSVCGVADRYINIVKRDGYPDNRLVCKRNFCPNCGADMRGEQA